MIPASVEQWTSFFGRLEKFKQIGEKGIARCPFHPDSNPSFSINLKQGVWNCFGCGEQGGAISFAERLNIPKETIPGWELSRRSEVRPPMPPSAVYDYKDDQGITRYQVVRDYRWKDGEWKKSFVHRRPDGNGGWIRNMQGVKRLLYRLPELCEAVVESKGDPTIFIPEGEKDVDNLRRLGLFATCKSGGALAPWESEHNVYLRGTDVIIIADKDDVGRTCARVIADSLNGLSKSTKVIEMPGRSKDVTEWLDAGGSKDDLLGIIKTAPHWPPSDSFHLSLPIPDKDETNKNAVNRTASLPEEPAPKVPKTQASKLLEVAKDIELFHNGEDCFASIPVAGHAETWSIFSKGFRRWLNARFFDLEGKAPSSNSIQEALETLSGRAQFRCPERSIFTRIGGDDKSIFFDLGDDSWTIIEITAAGWRTAADPPVKFRRPRGLLSLPMPKLGGSIDDLKPFVNINDGDWPLLIGWLIAAYRPNGPYPVLVLHGEQGTAKSTLCKILKALIDPNKAPLRSEPKEKRDLMISATNSWVIAFDNLSRLPVLLSDSICCLSTGGGFSTRELHSDQDEKLFEAKRPVILNGIEELATRGDLLDRSVILYLPTITEGKRKSEDEFWRDFESKRAGVLGGLLTGVCTAVKNIGAVKLSTLPRMADFAKWVTAAEPALGWEPGTFLKAYCGNREAANDLVLSAAEIAAPLLGFMEQMGRWKGTATELLRHLTPLAERNGFLPKSWPGSAAKLSNLLTRLAPNLRTAGLNVTNNPKARPRMIELELARKESSGSSASSCNGIKSAEADDGDDTDDNSPGFSKGLPKIPSDDGVGSDDDLLIKSFFSEADCDEPVRQ